MNGAEALYERWRRYAVGDPDLQAELREGSRSPDSAVQEAFSGDLAFGTGGLRGVMGAGPGRVNIYTVRRASQGLADYLRGQSAAAPVAIAYDSRLKSDLFAREAARVLAGNGIFVWLYPRLMPTPALSFAVRHLRCGAGVCVTASHNPAQYNGYKVYGPDGGQITNEIAAAISDTMARVDPFDDVKQSDFDGALERGLIRYINEDVVDAFIGAVAAQSVQKVRLDTPLRVVYTPLHGAGGECVAKMMERIGVRDLHFVKEQAVPDGTFPTCPSPNPENPEALVLGIQQMRALGADILLATDPDCDRVGVAVNHRGDLRLLTGNEVGILLLDYLCAMRHAAGTLPENPLAVSTIVSTSMATPVAARYGVSLRRVLTGFKYIGEQIGLLDQAGKARRFVFGFEESYGYLAGSYVRDKDAVGTCMLVCEMARWYKDNGKTLVDVLEELYRRHGAYVNTLHSFVYEGVEGQSAMRSVLGRLRQLPPESIAGMRVTETRDYLLPAVDADFALPAADVLSYSLETGAHIFVRPSGTEPKVKLYIETTADSHGKAAADNAALYGGMQKLLQETPAQPGPPGTGNRPGQGETWQSSNYPPPPRTTSGVARA